MAWSRQVGKDEIMKIGKRVSVGFARIWGRSIAMVVGCFFECDGYGFTRVTLCLGPVLVNVYLGTRRALEMSAKAEEN